ncbi:MAG: hypothetical protein A2X64_08325 [Ignavibacteria bacterium GWF2_33_9]|nr:MAG: hypothetical protein A2X64_08325 [Ignavibacteria bacterium GWF2_33_9]
MYKVYSKAGFDKRREIWREYHSKHHTSTYELGEIAGKARLKLVILYHILFRGATEQDLLDEIKVNYNGKVIECRDLDTF